MSDKPLTDITFSTFDLYPSLLTGLESAGFTRCTPIQAMTPVSYTHLDVYKRQRQHSVDVGRRDVEALRRTAHEFGACCDVITNRRDRGHWHCGSGQWRNRRCGSNGAVSYTHLDVYKRQMTELPFSKLVTRAKPVSYTHLDVYKRQVVDWSLVGAAGRAISPLPANSASGAASAKPRDKVNRVRLRFIEIPRRGAAWGG